jgi:hypothetical protein
MLVAYLTMLPLSGITSGWITRDDDDDDNGDG